MTVEEREQSERKQKYGCDQAVMKYLRAYFDADMLHDAEAYRKVLAKCCEIAEDFDMKRGIKPPREGYPPYITEVIDRYMRNWDGKVPGTDDRGHRFGKGIPPK